MSRVFEALCAHLKTHPEAEAQDAVKFLYQASFGSGHFLSDPDGAYLYLLKEAEIANPDAPYTEALGEQYARINLSVLRELSPKTLFAMFKASSENTPTDKTAFLSLLDELENGIGLIERKKQGQGKPAIIYLKKFYISENNDRKSRLLKIEIQDFRKSKVQTFENQNLIIINIIILILTILKRIILK